MYIYCHNVEDATLFTGILNTKKKQPNAIVEMKYNFVSKKKTKI